MLSKSFKSGKCKTSLKLGISRIKLLKNRRDNQVKQLRRELAQLLATGQEHTARIRVEHVIREEKTMSAYDLIEIYYELIVARMPIIESQKLGKKKVDESCSEDDDDVNDSDDDDETDGKSVVLDDGNFLRQNKGANMNPSTVIRSGASSDGESSGGASDQSNLEQANGNLLNEGSSGNVSEQSNSEELNDKCGIFPIADQSCPNWENNFGSTGSSKTESMVPESAVLNDDISNGVKEPEKDELKPELHSQIKPSVGDELDAQVIDYSSMEEPLNFDKYSSATELEVLGMDRLKMELQARGLKCGGTLQERASRFFLLKTTPLDKVPKKLLAKPTSQGK